jgi:predicted Zn-ribbon and HTH transcriptional regulator
MKYVGSMTTFGSSGKKGVFKPYLCKECGESSPDKFYGNQKIHCKKCHSKQTHERRKQIKRLAVEYLGGSCKKCGYNKYIGALQFHHRNPAEKDSVNFNKWLNFEVLKKELDKCDLLCANCHAEEHGGVP